MFALRYLQDSYMYARYGSNLSVMKDHFYSLIDRDMDGEEVSMSTFKGDVLLLANVASAWGLTKKNYTDFVSLHEKYADRGLKILAFPCNQFGGQEPGTHEEILTFVEKFNARDKLVFFEKADVNGSNAREVFSFLKEKIAFDNGEKGNIRWNFGKFLVDHEGNPYKRIGSRTNPIPDMVEDIEYLLKKREESLK